MPDGISEMVKTIKPCMEASKKQYEMMFFIPFEMSSKMSKAKTKEERKRILDEGIKKTTEKGKEFIDSSIKCLELILPLV